MKKIFTIALLIALTLPQVVAAQSLTLTQSLRSGQTNSEVSVLQRILNNLGKAVTVLGEETKFFGPKTTAAVKQLQCEHNIVCSGPTWGLVGPATRGLLSRLQSESAVLDASTEPGLVAHYSFENNTNDSVGINNGIQAGNPTYTAGKVGQAMQFDGVDDRLAMNSLFSTIPSAFTISSWVNWDSPETKSYQIAGKHDGSTQGFILGSINPSTASCSINNFDLKGKHWGLSANQWTMLTCSWDGSSLKLYVNGKMEASTTTTRIITTPNIPFFVGRWQNNSFFKGKIDELRVYDRALSASEVSDIYAGIVAAPVVTPTNGQCSTTLDQCTSGTSSDIADTSTNSLWSCNGSGGGTSASCSKPITVVATTTAPSIIVPIATSTAPVVVGNNVTAASCSQEDVQAAINTSKDGDTVTIPVGTCTWVKSVEIGSNNWDGTKNVYIGKNITLTGSGDAKTTGTNRTTIIDHVPSINTGSHALWVRTSALNNYILRVTNINFEGGTIAEDIYNHGMITIQGSGKNWRIDNNRIYLTRRSGFYVRASGGVIDHNNFDLKGWRVAIYGFNGSAAGYPNYNGQDVSWSTPVELGGGKTNFFVEDNVFKTVNQTTRGSAVDGWSGQRVVFRNNKLYNMLISNHGTESSSRLRGSVSFEFYNNETIEDQGDFTSDLVHVRSGTGVAFNNTFKGKFQNAMRIGNYRDFSPFVMWGSCTGLSPYDKNDGIVHETGVHNGVNSANPSNPSIKQVVDLSKNWTPNQFRGYSIHNTTTGKSTIITSNTSNIITYSSDSTFGNDVVFKNGEGYKVLRATICLDQAGRAEGAILTKDYDNPLPKAYPNQRLMPIFGWNNTLNGTKGKIVSSSAHVTENKDFYNDTVTYDSARGVYTATYKDDDGTTKNWEYKPYTYPHPLISGVIQLPSTPPSIVPTPSLPNPPLPVITVPTVPVPPTTPTDTDSDGVIDSLDRCPGTPTSLKSIVNNYGCPKPLLINFDIKPDLTNLDLSSIPVLELGRTNIGKVTWKEAVALTRTSAQLDLDTNLKIERNKVTLFSNVVPELNKPAQITLYGITQTNPTIMRDGVLCPETVCTINKYVQGTLIFTVTGFSTYEVVDGTKAPIFTQPVTPIDPPTTGDPTPQPISGGGGGGGSSTVGGGSLSNGGNTIGNSTNPSQQVVCSAGQVFSTVTGQRCTSNTNSQSQNSNYNFTRNLTLGSRGDDVKALQDALVSLGHLNLNGEPTTTYFGPATRQALIKYQASQGISPAQGYFGTLTRGRLQGSTPIYTQPVTPIQGSTFTRNLTVGDRGSDVTQLQNFLISQSLLDPSNNTGYFGPATKAALAAWQRVQGISPAEGYFGSITRGRMGY